MLLGSGMTPLQVLEALGLAQEEEEAEEEAAAEPATSAPPAATPAAAAADTAARVRALKAEAVRLKGRGDREGALAKARENLRSGD